jgi:hypothetical protein
LVAYYASQKKIPRYISLACRYLDLELAQQATSAAVSQPIDPLLKMSAIEGLSRSITNTFRKFVEESFHDEGNRPKSDLSPSVRRSGPA